MAVSPHGYGSGLRGRRSECGALDQIVADLRTGQSGVLVLRGEPGVGKSALLAYAAEAASGCRIVRAAGVESEMDLAYAGLHQLCAPLLEHLDRLPVPQRTALAIAFGLTVGAPPDRFLLGLAALSLLAEAAGEQPLLCIVDDAQWLDQPSAQTLAFVARRLLAEPLTLLFAIRPADGQRWFEGLPELPIHGLRDSDARSLLLDALPGPLDSEVCNRIVAESRGNPRALLDLPRTWSTGELAGGFGLVDSTVITGPVEASYLRRLQPLPAETRLLLLAAAAEPLGDLALLQRALDALGIGWPAAAPAEAADLIGFGDRVRFRHPRLRSAVYRSATAEDRRRVHRGLVGATDPELDPDRRAWHLAHATPGPDDDVAAQLEGSVGRARSRGGLAAAAAFLTRSSELTVDPVLRVERMLAAAELHVQAGALDAALRLLTAAEPGLRDEFAQARSALLRGRIARVSGAGRDAPAQLLDAARRLEPFDPGLAREAYLDAWGAALFAGRLARDAELLEASRAARAARPTHPLRPSDRLLAGLAALMTEGRSAAAPTLAQAVSTFRDDETTVEEGLRCGVLAATAAITLWDFESWDALVTRPVGLARTAGALSPLAMALNARGMIVAWSGDLQAAATVVAEAEAVTEASGIRSAPYGALLLAALRGREAEASALTDSAVRNAVAGGEGFAIQYARWTTAVLYNGLGRYAEALDAAREASEEAPELFLSAWALPELIEASVRVGDARLAAAAVERFAEIAAPASADWGAGVAARCRAVVSQGEAAEKWYREAIRRLGRTRLRPELARAHLLYGEWLRRENRRRDARSQLHTAYELFRVMGLDAFAERTRRELVATGETVRKRTFDTVYALTAKESQIAWLARDGLSNPEIAAQLYISARTVEWHLGKVFTKLGISSRTQLQDALTPAGQVAASA